MHDAVVVGSGPNGLAAAIALAREGHSVLVVEAKETAGGGMRSAELTRPGFVHDLCSACHPMGGLSPFFRKLPLEEHGLRWRRSPISAAHPLDDQPAVLLRRSVDETAAELDPEDARAYARLFSPFLSDPHGLMNDLLSPLGLPRHPLQMARFGLLGLPSAVSAFSSRFKGERARALLAGCAGHAILPLDGMLTAAVGMLFALTAHIEDWPVAEGGSRSIPDALVSYLGVLGGDLETGRAITKLDDLPPARAYLFDTSPAQLAAICAPVLPRGYLARLRKFRYGPGVFKIDYALRGPIPWTDPRVAEASTVHVGGTLDEIAAAEGAVWRGEHPERPYVMVVQQSALDETRAPAGQHTGYAYVHVPAGSTVDQTAAVERQLERFAPGFSDLVLQRRTMNTAQLEAHNPNYLGGAITGGVADLRQFFTRPVARLRPWTTPNPRVFLCSSSTPPGGGVHGMCGVHAARLAARRLARLPDTRLLSA